MEESPFRYTPLTHPREIRLLDVSLDPDGVDRIQCAFHIVPLDDLRCDYNAISYCWGSPVKTDKVWCNGQYIDVTASAMSVLRGALSEPGTGYIWIDALCIDQSNNAEKAVQVRLMRDVYASAKKVIAWLGDVRPNTEEVIDFLGTVRLALFKLVDRGGPINLQTLVDSDGCGWPSTGWTALSKILRNPWFERTWIIQEIVLANEIGLVYGIQSIPWQVMADVVNMVDEAGLSNVLINPVEEDVLEWPPGVLTVRNCVIYRSFRKASQPLDFSEVLVDHWRLEVTDGRDKIFALLGMASDPDDPAFQPDYEAPVGQIFRRATVRLLTLGGVSREVLHAAGVGHPRSLSALPSWVPDWTTFIGNTVLGKLAKRASYRASGDVSATKEILYNRERDCITLRGCVFEDIVASAGEIFPLLPVSQQGIAVLLSWLENLSTLWRPAIFYPGGSGLKYYPDVLYRTLIANVTSQGTPAPVEYLNHFENWVAMNDSLKNMTIEELRRARVDVHQAYSAATFRTAFSAIGTHRKLFATQDAYIGLGPVGVKKDDKICIFLGFNTPFIIRPRKEGGYLLVGECYIYGFMDGEALSHGTEEDITLF